MNTNNSAIEDYIHLHYQSCNAVKVAADALKQLGSKATIRFSKDKIICIHNNADNNVVIIIDVNTSELLKYEYRSQHPELLIGIQPALISTNIGNKKKEAIIITYKNRSMSMGLYSASQQRVESFGSTAVDILQGDNIEYIPPEYDDEPNVKVTASAFRKEMSNLNRNSPHIFIRPYTRGIQFLGMNTQNRMLYRADIGYTEGDEELFYSPDPSDDRNNEIYENNHNSIAHDPLSYFDHIQCRWTDIEPLLSISKESPDSSVLKFYFKDDRNLPIRATGPMSTDGIWLYHIQGIGDETD